MTGRRGVPRATRRVIMEGMEGKVFFDGSGAWETAAFPLRPLQPDRPLEGADLHRLRAAEGWLELGNPVEANRELDAISTNRGVHADVLLLRWHIYARAKIWPVCLVLANALSSRAPEEPRGWIALAETLYFMERTADAFTVASVKALEFPESWRLLYGAARYACVLGKVEEGAQFLERAMHVGDARALKRRARLDPELAPLVRRRTRQRPR